MNGSLTNVKIFLEIHIQRFRENKIIHTQNLLCTCVSPVLSVYLRIMYVVHMYVGFQLSTMQVSNYMYPVCKFLVCKFPII